MKKIKVINITGWGRSGSTILGNVLGEIKGFFFAGEVRNIWNRVIIEDRLCGCGVNFKECPVWSSIFNDAFGGMEAVDPIQMKKLIKMHTRTRHLPMLLLPGSKKILKENLKEYIGNLDKLFDSISKITNSEVIIDSSKTTISSFILSLLDNVDLYLIHLVRDPRGIAYSRQKKLVQPDKSQVTYMEQFSPWRSSLMWNARNVISELLWRNKPNYLMLRYEDFIGNPKGTIEDILKFTNETDKDLSFISGSEVDLNLNHSVWGNPSKFKVGKVKLKIDDEWKVKLNTKDKLISTISTLPLLMKYDYKILN